MKWYSKRAALMLLATTGLMGPLKAEEIAIENLHCYCISESNTPQAVRCEPIDWEYRRARGMDLHDQLMRCVTVPKLDGSTRDLFPFDIGLSR